MLYSAQALWDLENRKTDDLADAPAIMMTKQKRILLLRREIHPHLAINEAHTKQFEWKL